MSNTLSIATGGLVPCRSPGALATLGLLNCPGAIEAPAPTPGGGRAFRRRLTLSIPEALRREDEEIVLLLAQIVTRLH